MSFVPFGRKVPAVTNRRQKFCLHPKRRHAAALHSAFTSRCAFLTCRGTAASGLPSPHRRYEVAHFGGIFDARRRFHTAGCIEGGGLHLQHGVGNILRIQSAREDNRTLRLLRHAGGQGPIDYPACAPECGRSIRGIPRSREYAAPVTAGQPGTLSPLLCRFGTSKVVPGTHDQCLIRSRSCP